LAFADVILPAQSWGEKSGTVTNSERRISRQRSFLTPFGDAKPDWWIISQVAQKMGFVKQFNYQSPRDIFIEHAKLSGLNNHGTRAFDISAFSGISEKQYQDLIPVQWPQPQGRPIVVSDQLLFSEQDYFTPSRKAQMMSVVTTKWQKATNQSTDKFTLNTGRNRDQWHTQTRTGKSGILTNRHPEPMVDIHPDDATRHKIADNSLVTLESEYGQLLVRAQINNSQRRGELFVPIHWSRSNNNQGGVSQLIKPEFDPISGQPAFKHSLVSMAPWRANSEAMIVVKHPLSLDICHYQVEQRISGGYCYHLASLEQPERLYQRLNDLVLTNNNNDRGQLDTFTASDPGNQYFRQSYLASGEPVAAVVVGQFKGDLPTGWIGQFYCSSDKVEHNRQFISADIKGLQQQKTFCQCLNIQVADIDRAIEEGQLTVADIRAVTGAGGGCGSCIGDISLALHNMN
jgi:assimilatory nitrate reductase catalytic subunit